MTLTVHALILIALFLVMLVIGLIKEEFKKSWYWFQLLVGVAILFTLAACGSLPTKPATLTVHQRYEVACIDGGVAYSVITVGNNLHPLKAAQQRSALAARDKIDKYCRLKPGEDYPYSASDAVMSELEGAAATLDQLKEISK
jgi:hypothetical protein